MPAPTYLVDEKLKEWATERQKEYIDAVNKAGSIRGAARALSVNPECIRLAVAGARKKAAIFGYSPQHDLIKPVAPGFLAKGYSTAYDLRKPGAPAIIQWVKTSRDEKAQEEIIREAITALMQDVPRASPISAPSHVSADLCNVYTLTDCHVGMKAWGCETGADWDLDIADRTLCGPSITCYRQALRLKPEWSRSLATSCTSTA